MYMTNEKWEQNNQDYLKESYEETGFTAGGYAVRKLICGGCGRVFYTTIYTKKYCHSYWCGNQANNRRQREYRQMRRQDLVCQCCGEKFTPKRADARYCSNACRQKDYRKRVTDAASVTNPSNKALSLTNEGTEIHRPVTENQVVKMSTSFFVPSQGLLKIRYRHPVLDFTRNGISGSKWPTEKAGRAAGRNSQIFACQLARSKSAERCGSPAATSKGHWPFEAPTEPTGETSSLQGSRVKPLPSDMMLCVISYWVLSGAKRRQIQQLRCCVLHRQAVETEGCLLRSLRPSLANTFMYWTGHCIWTKALPTSMSAMCSTARTSTAR